MAKTRLDIESEGWRQLTAEIDKVLASGDKLVTQATDIADAQTNAATTGAKAQADYLKSQQEILASKKIEANLTTQLTQAQVAGREKIVVSTNALIAAVKALNAESGKTKFTNEEIVKKAVEMQKGYDQLLTKVTELDAGLVKIAADAGKAADESKRIGEGTATGADSIATAAAKAQFALDGMLAQQREIRQEAAAVTEEMKAGTIEQEKGLAIIDRLSQEYSALTQDITGIKTALKDVGSQSGLADSLTTANGALTQQIGLIGELEAEIKSLEAARASATDEEDIKRINAQLATAKTRLTDLKKVGLPKLELDEAKIVEPVLTLRTQLRNATIDAEAAKQKFGEFSPEFEKAATRAAELKQSLENTRQSIEALNPEKKLAAIGQLATSIAGGFTAVQGIMALVGSESEDLQKGLLKVQAALAVTQGLNSLFSGLSSSIQNITLWLRAATGASAAFGVAQKGAAVATTVATEATVAGTVATEASTVATVGMTGAVRTLTAALAANPLIAAATVLLGIVAALVLTGDEAENASEKTAKLIDEMQKFQQVEFSRIDFNARLRALRDEKELLEAGNTAAAQRADIENRNANASIAIDAKLAHLDIDRTQRVLELTYAYRQLGEAIRSDDDDGIEQAKQRIKDLAKAADEAGELRKDLAREQEEVNKKTENEITAFNLQQAEERKRIAKDEAAFRLKLQEAFQKEMGALLRKTVEDTRSSQIETLQAEADQARHNGQLQREKEFREQILEIQQNSAEESIDIAQRTLERTLATIELERTLGVQAIKDMSEEQLKARQDALIAEGKVQLPPEVLENFARQRQNIEARFARLRLQLAIDTEAAIEKVQDDALKTSLQNLTEQEKLAEAQLENAADNRAAIVQILKDNGIEEVKTIKNTEQAKLAIAIKSAEDQIAILEASGDKANAVLAENLKTLVTKLKTEFNVAGQFNLLEALGFTKEQIDALQPLLQQFGQFFSQSLNNIFQAEVANNQAFIGLLEDRIAAVQDAIAREQAAREEGLANNLDAEEEKLAILQKQREDALKEQQKLADRQKSIETGLQVSQLLTGVAGLIKDSALKSGVIGLAVAAAFIPVLFALFKNAKGTAESAVQLYKGEPYVDSQGKYRPGRDTVPAMLTRGERVVPVDDNARHRDLYDGIHYDDPRLLQRGILQAADHYGLMDKLAQHFAARAPKLMPALDFALPQRMRDDDELIRQMNVSAHLHPDVLRRLESIDRNMEAMVGRKSYTSHAEGNTLIEVDGSTTRYIKKG